jgi:protein gp37
VGDRERQELVGPAPAVAGLVLKGANVGDTKIEWATRVWNPTRGCRRVSPGCENCYAERQAIRHSGPGRPYEGLVVLGRHGPRWTGEGRFLPNKLDEPLRWAGHQRVFVDSMSDLFYEGFHDDEIAAVFGVMAACPQHDFLVLTKRPERARAWFGSIGSAGWAERRCHSAAALWMRNGLPHPRDNTWPLPNVWIGVSVEDQERADERIPLLLQLPAAVRFVSAEPLVGPVDLSPYLAGARLVPRPASLDPRAATYPARLAVPAPRLDWVIVGGESGPGARPMDLQWARQVVQACAAGGVPCFVKQLGAAPISGRMDDYVGRRTFMWNGGYAQRLAMVLADRKGGDPAEWPQDLRTRRFPHKHRVSNEQEKEEVPPAAGPQVPETPAG